MARKIVRNSKGSRKTIRTYQEGGIIVGGTQSFADREDERIGDDTEGMYQRGGPKVRVTKQKRGPKVRASNAQPVEENPWVSSEDIKSKDVSRKRAERMKKRGWTESKRY